jgi:hypothetical protein
LKQANMLCMMFDINSITRNVRLVMFFFVAPQALKFKAFVVERSIKPERKSSHKMCEKSRVFERISSEKKHFVDMGDGLNKHQRNKGQ